MKTLETTTESGTYLMVELPEKLIGKAMFIRANILGYDNCAVMELQSGNWQPIGSGKDHPKLVQELGLLSENPHILQVCGEQGTCFCKRECGNKAWQQAESKVFKKPAILHKIYGSNFQLQDRR